MIETDLKIKRVNDAVALKEPDRVPFVPYIASVAQRLNGSSYRDLYYDFDRAGEAVVKFYSEYDTDAHTFSGFTSGKSNELAQSSMIDWPGRPETRLSIYSSHQVIEREYMSPDEYSELLNDYTGFMFRKYIPRAFPALKGLKDVNLYSAMILNTGFFRNALNKKAMDAYSLLSEIKKYDNAASEASAKYRNEIGKLGIPAAWSGVSEAPYDILGDYYRGTMGMFNDLVEREDMIATACDMFAEQQIQSLQYFKYVDMPVKRVFFPLHKGMDGFMSPRQYEELYWKPLKKVFMALIEMNVTPVAYSEGKYNTRLEHFLDLPKGKVVLHIESADMARAKSILGDTVCIAGNLPVYLLEFGTKEQVEDYCKFLIDTCAPGRGYIFDTDALIENAKHENLEIMRDTVLTYGAK